MKHQKHWNSDEDPFINYVTPKRGCACYFVTKCDSRRGLDSIALRYDKVTAMMLCLSTDPLNDYHHSHYVLCPPYFKCFECPVRFHLWWTIFLSPLAVLIVFSYACDVTFQPYSCYNFAASADLGTLYYDLVVQRKMTYYVSTGNRTRAFSIAVQCFLTTELPRPTTVVCRVSYSTNVLKQINA